MTSPKGYDKNLPETLTAAAVKAPENRWDWKRIRLRFLIPKDRWKMRFAIKDQSNVVRYTSFMDPMVVLEFPPFFRGEPKWRR